MNNTSNDKKSESYEFTIKKGQHPTYIPTLQSKVMQNYTLTDKDKIDKEIAREIIEEFQISNKECNTIINKIPPEGILLGEFLQEIAQKGYSYQNIADFNRGIPNITVHGEDTAIFDKASGRFQKKDGSEVMDWNKQKFSSDPKSLNEQPQEFKSLDTFTELLKERGVSNVDLVTTMFNQNTLKGFIGDAFSRHGPFGSAGQPSLDKIELIIEQGNVVGFNLTGRYTIGNIDEGSNLENTINFVTEIKLSKSSNTLGMCEVQSIDSRFSAVGDKSQEFLRTMKRNIEDGIDNTELIAKSMNLNIASELVVEAEKKLIERAKKVGISEEKVKTSLLDIEKTRDFLTELGQKEKKQGLFATIKQFFVNLVSAIRNMFTSGEDKQQSDTLNKPNMQIEKNPQQSNNIDIQPKLNAQDTPVKKNITIHKNQDLSEQKVTVAKLPLSPPTLNINASKRSGQGRS